MRKLLSLSKLFLFVCILLLSVACGSGKEKTVDEKVHAVEIKEKLEIMEKGDVIEWYSGVYSFAHMVDGMPNRKNQQIKLQCGVTYDKEWKDLDMNTNMSFLIKKVYLYKEARTTFEQAAYAEVLRKAALGIVDKK